MFQLNENSMKRIMREEYTKRLKQFLAEEMTVEYGKGADKQSLIKNARGLKVRHDKTGLEYVIWNFDEAAGNVVLLLPDESRLDTNLPSTARLYEADIDGDGIPDELDNEIEDMKNILNDPIDQQRRKVSTDKLNLINYNKKQNPSAKADKKFIVVPIEEFINDYSL